MRVLIVTAGSRGDVAPYTGLGVRLHRSPQPSSNSSAQPETRRSAGRVVVDAFRRDPIERIAMRTRNGQWHAHV